MCDETREESFVLLKDVSNTAAGTVYVYNHVYGKFSKFDLSPTGAGASQLTALAMQRETLTPGQKPWPLFGQYVNGGLPKVLRDDSTGNTLPATVILQRFGDPLTLKQFVDCTWILNKEADGVVEIVGTWNGTADGSRTFAKATRVDARATLGVPRSDALRASVEPGCTIASVAIDVKLLGVSFRVVPKTTQVEVR